MKLVIGSDFHNEFQGQVAIPPPPKGDVLVLAGDINTGLKGLQYAEEVATGLTVYVPGNHEYYGKFKFQLNDDFAEYSHEKVKVLNPGIIEVGEYVIIGATLHSALRLPNYKYFAPVAYSNAIGDFIVTKFWTPEQHIQAHLEEVRFIEEALVKYKDKKCIVVTHFVPSMQAINKYWEGNQLNPYFINDLDWLINDHRPLAWIFGHTHDRHDFTHKNGVTRMICNPRGYPKEKPRAWAWKVVEL